MTVLGLIFFAAAIASTVCRPRAFWWVFAASAAFPTSAAVSFHGIAVPPFYALSLVVPAVLAARRNRSPSLPASLVFFVCWALFVTVSAPVLFAGIPVLPSSHGGGASGILGEVGLSFNLSQFAQTVYLLLCVAVVSCFSRCEVNPDTIAGGLGVGTLVAFTNLAFLRLGLSWPHYLFDNGTASYGMGTYLGQERLRGQFSEPSVLADFSVASAVYFFVSLARVSGYKRIVYCALGLVAFLNALASASGTGVVALTVVSGLAVIAALLRFIGSGGRRGAAALVWGVPVVLLIGVLFGRDFGGSAASLISAKLQSHSAAARSFQDGFSWHLFLHTFGYGTGLGSNRSSSFVVTMLSTVGAIGALLYGWFFCRTVLGAARVPAGAPIVAAAVAGLVAKATAVPDLSSPYLWLLLAAGVSLTARRTPNKSGATAPSVIGADRWGGVSALTFEHPRPLP